MTKIELQETQRESIEICRNVTSDLRLNAITFLQWWEVTRRALLDFWGAVAEYRN